MAAVGAGARPVRSLAERLAACTGRAIAEAGRSAGAARAQQAGALWRPSVSLEGGAGIASNETSVTGARFGTPAFGQSRDVTFDTSIIGGTSGRFALTLKQPIHDRERDARGEVLETSAEAAGIEWTLARQELMLRTVDTYFDAALAAERLSLLEREPRAVEMAGTEARDRFRLGGRPGPAVPEAAARAAALRSERLAAQNRVTLSRAALSDLMGAPVEGRLRLPAASRADAGPGDGLGEQADWLARADRDSPALKLAAARLRMMQAQADAARHAYGPSVDIVARLARDRLAGDGDFGRASNRSRSDAVGIQVSVPLYTGGMGAAQAAEATAGVDRAAAELERTRLQVAQQARGAWLELSIGRSRLDALEAAVKASRARLDATRVGLQAGDRTTLALLNAENDASAAELELSVTRVRLLGHRLRLAALVDGLDDAALAQVDLLLQPVPDQAHGRREAGP